MGLLTEGWPGLRYSDAPEPASSSGASEYLSPGHPGAPVFGGALAPEYGGEGGVGGDPRNLLV